MAKISLKQKYETPIGELQYVMVWGNGKFKYGAKDEQDPTNYEYQAGLNLDFSEQGREQAKNLVISKMIEQLEKEGKEQDEIDEILDSRSKEIEKEVNKIISKRKENYEIIKADIDEFWQDAREKFGKTLKAKPAWSPLKLRKDPETDEEIEGAYSFNAKTIANWVDKKTGQVRKQIIPIYDYKGRDIRKKLIESNIYIGNGSKGIIYCTLTLLSDGNETNPKYGVTAYLEAIQIAKLEKYTNEGISKDRLKVIDEGEDIDFEVEQEADVESADTVEEPEV